MTEVDISLFRYLHDALSGSWLGLMVVFSAIGGGWGSLAALPLFASKRTRAVGTILAGVLITTAILVFALKRIVGRPRPFVALHGVHAVVNAPNDYSFPSGHSAGSFAFAVFLAIVLVRSSRAHWPFALGLVLLAVLVGLSRIALGVHFPGDVLAGAILGASVATVGATLHARRAAS